MWPYPRRNRGLTVNQFTWIRIPPVTPILRPAKVIRRDQLDRSHGLRTMNWGFGFSTADQVFFASSNGQETSLRSSEWPFDPAREDHAREADWRGTPLSTEQ